jgi:hypothetical protein
VTSGQIVSGPSNVAAAIGSQTYFNCTATSLGSEILLWQKLTAGSYEDLYISNKPDTLNPAFGIDIDSTNGHYNLIVKNVALDLGTKYWCTVLGTNSKYYGELVAVGGLYMSIITM